MQQRFIYTLNPRATKLFEMIKKLTLTARQRKGLGIAVALFALYTLAGFFLVPAVLRYKLPDMIRDATGRDSSIAAAAFHPFLLRVKLQGFELKEKNGAAFGIPSLLEFRVSARVLNGKASNLRA